MEQVEPKLTWRADVSEGLQFLKIHVAMELISSI